MRRFLSSPRRRRRVAGGLVAAAVAASVAVAVNALPNRTPERDLPRAAPGPPVLIKAPKEVRVSRIDVEAARATVAAFVVTAVLRKKVEQSWDLVTPAFRAGLTRAQWRSGDIPVVPYTDGRLRQVRMQPLYSYENTLGFNVGFIPESKDAGPTAFMVELRATGQTTPRTWRIDAWVPSLTVQNLRDGQRAGATAAPTVREVESALSPMWLIVPATLLALVAAIPVALGVREWRRGVRAARAYEASL